MKVLIEEGNIYGPYIGFENVDVEDVERDGIEIDAANIDEAMEEYYSSILCFDNYYPAFDGSEEETKLVDMILDKQGLRNSDDCIFFFYVDEDEYGDKMVYHEQAGFTRIDDEMMDEMREKMAEQQSSKSKEEATK